MNTEATMRMGEYEDRLIAYIDILGWSQACLSDASSQRLYDVLNVIHRVGDTYNEQERIAQLEREKSGFTRSNWMHLQVQVAVFSDCLAISMPEKFGSSILNAAAGIAKSLLTAGFLCRGGIARGAICHFDNVVFGPALIEAVRLEKQAKLPVILCSTEVVQQVLRELDAANHVCLMNDPCGRFVVDPFFPPVKFSDDVDQSTAIPAMLEFNAIEASFKAAFSAQMDEAALSNWQCAKQLIITSLGRYGPAEQSMISRLECLGDTSRDPIP
jgi:hypothetical protein